MDAPRLLFPLKDSGRLLLALFVGVVCLMAAASAEDPDAFWEPGTHTARENPSATGLGYLRDQSARTVLVMATSKDGKHETELIDVFTGKEIGTVRPQEPKRSLGSYFSWDGDTLVLIAHHFSVQGFDVREGKALGKPIPFAEKIPPPYSVWPIANRREMLRLEEGGTKVARWDLVKGEKVGEVIALPEAAQIVMCRPDGKSFLTYGEKGRKIRLWDIKSGKEIAKPYAVPPRVSVAPQHAGYRMMTAYCLSPDGGLFLIGPQGQNNKIKEWQLLDLEAGKILWKFDHNLTVFSENGKRLARLVGTLEAPIAPTATSVSVHDSRTGKLVRSIKLVGPEKGVTAYGTAVALSPEGRYLAVGCYLKGPRPKDPSKRREGMLQVFDLNSGKPASEKQFYQHAPTSIRFTPDGKAFTAVTWSRNQANDKAGKLEIQVWQRKGTQSPGDKDQSPKDKNSKEKGGKDKQ